MRSGIGGMTRRDETEPRNVSRRDLVVVAAVYLVAFAVLMGMPHPANGFPLDDSWIHQVVARNLARDGTLGFVPEVRSSGSSSLLWTVVLAAKWRVLPGLNPVLYSAAISAGLLVAMGWGLLGMARRDGLAESACWVWALTPALDGNFMWLGAIGMEHLLFVALSVLGVYLWFQAGQETAAGSALCLGMLALTRPEGMVLAVLAAAGARWARRGRVEVGILAALVGVCVCASLVANFVTSRSWLPTTYAGRKWLYFGSDHVPPLAHVVFPYQLFQLLLEPWTIRPTHPLYTVDLLIAVLTAAGVWRLVAEHRVQTAFLVLWSFVHIAIYAAMLPTRAHGGRYQPLFLALSFPLMFLGAEALWRRWGGGGGRGWAMAVLCVACGVPSLVAWRRVTSAGVALIEGTHARMGRYLVEKLPPGSRVAALDIGRIGYLYGGSLGDMGGLTDSTFLPYMKEHRAFDYLKEHRIGYLVWPTSEEGQFDSAQVLRFTPENAATMTEVSRFCAPYGEWFVSYRVTMDAAPCQRLYRLREEDVVERP